jgi:lipid-binding SYLF domain-containing protein
MCRSSFTVNAASADEGSLMRRAAPAARTLHPPSLPGADVNVAVGPIGAGAEAATAGLSVDLLVFSRSKGLYGGISLQGAVISTRDTLNHAFYGRAVSTTDILLQGTALSDKATGLLMSVSQFPQAR